jgi:hypothetical protein
MPYEQVLRDIESRDAADYSRPVGALKKVRVLAPLLSLQSAPGHGAGGRLRVLWSWTAAA